MPPGRGFALLPLPVLPLAMAALLAAGCGGKGSPDGAVPAGQGAPAPGPAATAAAPGAAGRVGSGEPFVPVAPPGGKADPAMPRVTAIRFVPDPARPSSGMAVEVKGESPRGKGFEHEVSWERNGEPVGAGPALPVAAKRGDVLRVTVRPYDAAGYGTPVTVEREVRNAPPAVGSPVDVSFDGSAWSARVPAEDGDGDPLSFRLKAGPAGMAVDGAGKVTWTVPPDFAGTAAATVAVSDGAGGESEGTFRVTIRKE